MYNLISIALLVLGLAILFYPDTILDKNTSNEYLQMIYQKKTLVGSVCVAGAYYAYTLAQKEIHSFVVSPTAPLPIPQAIVPEGNTSSNGLPSYEQSLDTSDVLRL